MSILGQMKLVRDKAMINCKFISHHDQEIPDERCVLLHEHYVSLTHYIYEGHTESHEQQFFVK